MIRQANELGGVTAARKEVLLMKATGVVRKVDELGRVVLPIELRRNLGINEKDSLEIYVDGSQIILKKYDPACVFCGESAGVTLFKEKRVCARCLAEMKAMPLGE